MSEANRRREAKSKSIRLFNEELDRRIGGIPHPTLALLEGANDSGKSVLAQQIAYGAVQEKRVVRYITTENTVESLLSQMDSISLSLYDAFVEGLFKVTELHAEGLKWREVSRLYLMAILKLVERDELSEIFVIDSLTYLVTHASEESVLEFFSSCRRLVDEGTKTLVITLHPYAFRQDMLVRIRSICDAHFNLTVKEVGDRTIRTLEVAKLRGANKSSGVIIPFEVDTAFGIKVLPFSQARA